MKTIKITEDYYIRITKRDYIVYKLVIRPTTSKKVLQAPTYHTKFDSALRDVYNRTVRDKLVADDVHELKDAIATIEKTYEDFKALIAKSEDGFIETSYDDIETDDTEENDEDIDTQEVEE